jgi:hypothetical protein
MAGGGGGVLGVVRVALGSGGADVTSPIGGLMGGDDDIRVRFFELSE